MGFLGGGKKKRSNSRTRKISESASASASASTSSNGNNSDIDSTYKEMTDDDNGNILQKGNSNESDGGVRVTTTTSRNTAHYEYALRQYNRTIRPGSHENSRTVKSSDSDETTQQKNKNDDDTNDVDIAATPTKSNGSKAKKEKKKKATFDSKHTIIRSSLPTSNSLPAPSSTPSSPGSAANKLTASSLSYSRSGSYDPQSQPPSQSKSQSFSNTNIKPRGGGSTSTSRSHYPQVTSRWSGYEDDGNDDDYSDSDSDSSQLKLHPPRQQGSSSDLLQSNNDSNNHNHQNYNINQQPQQKPRSMALPVNATAPPPILSAGTSTSTFMDNGTDNVDLQHIYSYPNYPGSPTRRPTTTTPNNNNNDTTPSSSNTNPSNNKNINNAYYSSPNTYNSTSLYYCSPEPEMVDVTYEEKYGDAYVNKPIRYIYPAGYGNMRPKSKPWKVSILFCAVFAWLNLFIVGHCSDRFDWDNYYVEGDDANDGDGNANGNNAQYYGQYFDDDQMMIETRWCGSRPLYFMWVFSMIVAGASCAYCSIVGYIKARDFSVANNRSQQPGMVGRSDYYVQIEEEFDFKGNRRFTSSGSGSDACFGSDYSSYQGRGLGNKNQGKKKSWYKKTLYQADGTPRYFGGRIYRPTQAAVNITSR